MAAPIIEFLDDGVDFVSIVRQLTASRQQSAPATATSLGALMWHVSFVLVLTTHVGYLVRHAMPRPLPKPQRRLSSTYIAIQVCRVESTSDDRPFLHLANIVPGSILFAAFATIYYGMQSHISHTTAMASILSYWSYSLSIVGALTTTFATSHEVVGTIACFVGLTVIFPPVLWSSWLGEGWFNPHSTQALFGVGAVDFGGSGVLHVVPGILTLVVSTVLPRSATPTKAFARHPGYAFAGTTMLWLGTCGLLLNRAALVVPPLHQLSATVGCLVNTSLAFAGGGLVGFSIELYDSADTANAHSSALHVSCAAAMVAILGLGPLAEPYLACLVGISAAVIVHFIRQTKWLSSMEPTIGQTTAIHVFGGMWGVCTGGLGGTPRNHDNIYGTASGKPSFGLLYEHRGSGGAGALQLATNLIYLGSVMAWTFAIALALVSVLRRYGLGQDTPEVAFDVDFARDDGYMPFLDDRGPDHRGDFTPHNPVDRCRSSDIMGRRSSAQSSIVSGSTSPSLQELQERRRNSPFAWMWQSKTSTSPLVS